MSSSLKNQRLKTIEMISSINKDLRAKGHRATLEITNNQIRIRGTFPFQNGVKKRTYISTGLTADPKSPPLAEIRCIALLTAIKNDDISKMHNLNDALSLSYLLTKL